MAKKMKKVMITIGLVISMVLGQIVLGPIKAEETGNPNDYSDTTRMRDVSTLEVDVASVSDLRSFSASPLYDVENNELLLPRLEGYKVEVFGSDNKATISLEGKVQRPLQTQTVKLLYKLTNLTDGAVTTTETNAIVKIPAREIEVVRGDNAKPNVIPGLREWVAGQGSVDLTNARIVLGSEVFRKAATTFKGYYTSMSGRSIQIISGNSSNLQPGDIYIGEVEDALLGDEGYYMYIGGKQANKEYIEIEATHNTGALYGTISILQILKQDAGRNNLPKGLVKDYPLFEQRGMMLDVARKWFPMEYLNDLAKQMSWYKLNMLSLHLSDNDIWNGLSTENGRGGEPEGWFRLESEQFPELNQNSDGYDRGEYYTKEQFRNYQYSSMDLGIDVIPELDTPGHALAYTRAWPGTQRVDNAKYLDAKNPDVLDKVKALFTEYINGYNGGAPTFVGPYVNIGTDEYKSPDSSNKEAFRKYCDALLKHINSLEKEAVFWGSLTENNGTTPVTTDATMFAWYQGYANAKQSLDAGYKVISMEDSEVYIVPGGGYYNNQFGRAEYLYNSWMPNNNYGWAGNPAPDAHPRVMGGQFAVWNDFSFNGTTVHDINYRIKDNMYVIAEKCWAGKQTKEEGKSYANVKAVAEALGDGPNADFLYKVDKAVENNELLKLDDDLHNKVTINTGVSLGQSEGIETGVVGRHDNGIKLVGGTSYVETDIKSPGFGWTTSMWIKPEGDGILMDGKTGTLRLKNGKIQYNVEQYTHEFAASIDNNQWTHIALTGTYEGVTLYINGILSESLIGKPFPNWNNNSGCNSWNGDYPTNALGQRTQRYYQTLMLPMETIGSKEGAISASIDELNIYNKVLSKEEIALLAGTEPDYPRQNVALHKEAEEGNFNTGEGGRPGNNAIDGDLETRWEFALNNSNTNYISIPLENDEDVEKIIIKQMVWGGTNRIKDIRVVSLKDGVEIEVFNETAYDQGVVDAGNKISTREIILPTKVETDADAIKIYLTPKAAGADDLINIREIELYGTKPLEEEEVISDYTNIPHASMQVSATDEHPNYGDYEGPARFAIDDNPGTYWHTNWNEAKGLPQSITLSLDEIQYVGKYTYLPRQSGTGGIVTQYTLEVSVDGKTYTKVAQGNWEQNSNAKELVFEPVFAKYVRFTVLAGAANHGSAAELNVATFSVNSKERLEAMLVQAKGLKDGFFIEDTKEDLNKAIEEVTAVANGNPTERDITNAYQRLYKAASILQEGADLTELVALYEANKDLDAAEYAKNAYAKYTELKGQIKQVIGSDKAYHKNEIDNLKNDFELAIENLALLTPLKEWIILGEGIDGMDASEATRNELKKRLDIAKQLVNNDATTANQVQIALYHLQYAINDLVPDPTELQTLIAHYEANMYTSSSWAVFTPHLETAKEAVEKYTTIQELTEERTALLSHAKQLVLNATTDSLKELQDIVDKAGTLNSDDYQPAKWQEYMIIVEQAKSLLTRKDDVSQVEVDKALTSLRDYPLVVDKTELSTLINKAKEYTKKDIYTKDSIDALKAAITKAQDVVNHDAASKDDVSKAMQDLNTAIANLKEKPVEPPIPPVIEDKYEIIEGKQTVIKVGQKAAFRSNAPIEKFKEVLLDGKILDSKYYTVTEGSTIVTLKPEFTKTLAKGEHKLVIVSLDGQASTTFTVDHAIEQSEQPIDEGMTPGTGDYSQISLWSTLILIGGLGVVLVLKKDMNRKKR